jgi:hypothetical protein
MTVLELVLTLIAVSLVFSLVVIVGGRLAITYIGAAIDRQQREQQWIIATGLVPDTWSKRYRRRLALLERAGASAGLLDWVKRRYKIRVERRLAGLVRYIAESNVINDEGVRRSLATAMRSVGRSWEQSSWDEMTGATTHSDETSDPL